MKVAVVFHKETITADTMKEAYLDACKWVAKHVVSKVEVSETLVKYTKVPAKTSDDFPAVVVELHALLDTEHDNNFCDRCREFHSSFFLNQQFNCDRCNYTAFHQQITKKLSIKKQYRKEQLSRSFEGLY